MTDKIIIYAPSGDSYISVPVTRDAIISCSLMGDCYTLLSFRHNQLLPISRGFAIYHSVRKWEIMDEVFPQRDANGGYKYELKFYAQQHHMKRCRVFWTQNNIREATFNLTTTLSTYAKLICDNMNAFLSNGEAKNIMHWSVGSIPEELNEKSLNYAFNGVTCWNAVDDIAKLFEVEWWVEDDSKKNSATLNFGKCELNEVEDFEEGKIVKELPTPRRGDSSEYGTRFYVFGGTRNLPEDYNANKQGGETNHVSEKRLHLPDGVPYIDAYNGLKGCDVVEQVVFLDYIYPKNTETVTDVFTRKVTADGKIYTYWNIVCENTAFVPSNMIENAPLSAVFTSGSLNGREFELYIEKKNDLTFDKTFEINDKTDGSGDTAVTIPNEYLKPEIGDTFVLTGVKLPERYVREAENTLLEMAAEVVKERSGDTTIYECSTNVPYCTKNDKSFELGQRVRLKGGAFGDTGRLSRIQKLERKLYNKYDAVYSIGDNTPYSKYNFLQGKIVSVIDSEAKLEDSQSTLDGRNKREKIKISELTDNKADKNDLAATNNSLDNLIDGYDGLISWQQGFMWGIPEDTPKGISTGITVGRNWVFVEKRNVESDSETIDEQFSGYLAEWERYTTSNDEVYLTSDGQEYLVRGENEAYDKYITAKKSYIGVLDNVLDSNIGDLPPDDFDSKQKEYYNAREKVLIQIYKKSNIAYLQKVFGAKKVFNSDAAILASLVGVQSALGEVKAGLYGGGVEILNKEGYSDEEHGVLMLFAGAPSAEDASNAKFRVYEDGTLYANKGVFGGIIMRGKTTLTPETIGLYIHTYDDNGIIKAEIDLTKTGSYIELIGFKDCWVTGVNNLTTITLPYYDGSKNVDKGDIDKMLSMIGAEIIIKISSDVLEGLCFNVPDVVGGNDNIAGIIPYCAEMRKGDILVAQCVPAKSHDDKLLIGWNVKRYKE